MIIEINETNGFAFEGTVLKDLGVYRNLESWIMGIKNEEVAFCPLNCSININDRTILVVLEEQIVDDIESVIKEIKKIPSKFRNFPNDYIKIVADTFERELFFYINY